MGDIDQGDNVLAVISQKVESDFPSHLMSSKYKVYNRLHPKKPKTKSQPKALSFSYGTIGRSTLTKSTAASLIEFRQPTQNPAYKSHVIKDIKHSIRRTKEMEIEEAQQIPVIASTLPPKYSVFDYDSPEDEPEDESEEFIPLHKKAGRLSTIKRPAPPRRKPIKKKQKVQPEIILLSDSEDEKEEEPVPMVDNNSSGPPSQSKYISGVTLSPTAFCKDGKIFRSSKEDQKIRLLASGLEYNVNGEKFLVNYTELKPWVYGKGTSLFILCIRNKTSHFISNLTGSEEEQEELVPMEAFFSMIFEHDLYEELIELSNVRPFIEISKPKMGSAEETDLLRIEEFYLNTIQSEKRRVTRAMSRGDKQRKGMSHEIYLVWPRPPKKDAVSILASDLELLEPEEFLNDNIIDFYIKYIRYRLLPDQEEEQANFYFFNTFLYKMISQPYSETSGVLKWTGDIDIFTKDFLIIPVNQSLHWLLAIVCYPCEVVDYETKKEDNRACILMFDSMRSHSRNSSITTNIRKYLSLMWKAKRPEIFCKFDRHSLPMKRLKVPQQSNGSDCGVFLLHYIEKFSQNPKSGQDDYSPDWFLEDEVKEKRGEILSIIQRLHAEQEPEVSPSEEEDDPNASDIPQHEHINNDTTPCINKESP